MKKLLNNRWLILGSRIVLGAIFLTASISKILDRSGFTSTVVGYGVLPRSLAEAYGWIIPWVELYLGCSVLLGVLPRISAGLSIPVIISFIVASSYALVKSPGSVCGCFGNFVALSHPVSLTIDGIMLLFSVALLFNKSPEFFTVGRMPILRSTSSTVTLNGKHAHAYFWNKTKIRYYSTLLVVVALAMAGVTALSFGGQKLAAQTPIVPETQLTIKIPAPFNDVVSASLKAGKPVLVYVYFQGCAACEDAAPIIQQLSDDYNQTVTYLPIDYDNYIKEVLEMGVTTTPTVYLITGKNQDGSFTVSQSFVGSVEREALEAALQKATGGR